MSTAIEQAPESGTPAMTREEAARELAFVDDQIQEFREQLAPALKYKARLEEHLRAIMRSENAALALAGEYKITRNDPKPELERRIGDLRALYKLVDEGVLPLEDVQKAIWEHTPEPEWKTDLRKLRGLAKYGDRVRAILDKGLVESITGFATYSFERIRPQIDVTPAEKR